MRAARRRLCSRFQPLIPACTSIQEVVESRVGHVGAHHVPGLTTLSGPLNNWATKNPRANADKAAANEVKQDLLNAPAGK
jgi:hypothetical protein